MSWVLQSKGVPKELCSKVALYIRKPRHSITEEELFMEKLFLDIKRNMMWSTYNIEHMQPRSYIIDMVRR